MKTLFVVLILSLTANAIAQVSQKEFDFLSKYYNDQYKKLIEARGIDTTGYFKSKYVNQNDPSKISGVISTYFGESGARIAALMYFYFDSTFYVFLADKDSVRKISAVHVPLQTITSLNDRMINALKVKKFSQDRAPRQRGVMAGDDAYPEDFSTVNSEASALLLPDTSILKYEHLVIVPCMNLGAFPFYLLRANDKYLVQTLSYSIAPSLIEVEACCRKNAAKLRRPQLGEKIKYKFQKPLLVANPTYPASTRFIFPDLPGARKEVEGSLKYFQDVPFEYYRGDSATKGNVMKDFKDHDLLYFATHGMSSTSSPLDSCFLVLAGEKSPFLTNREILKYFDSTTNMDLVILSACQTGLGRSMDAGIIGLSRAFQIAGANHVVMSLWNVDDEATAFMMQVFLSRIQVATQFFPAEPLRQAILATMKRFPDPSAWASFALFGVPY